MSWSPDSLSPAMLDILAWIKSGYVLESRLAPNWDGKPPTQRYWLRRPHQTNSLRIQLSTVTVKALIRRGLIEDKGREQTLDCDALKRRGLL